ncbi:MAG: NAD-binding protein [Halobacteriaceae archaeon]
MGGSWQQWAGPRITVGLTVFVSILSIVTGIVNIESAATVPLVAPYVPQAIQTTAGFTGTLTGFLMLMTALGLRRGLKVAWQSAIVLLPITALQGIIQASPWSVPLVILSLVSLPIVGLSRKHFTRGISISTTQIAGLTALIGTQIYGTLGAYALREEFTNLNTILDAFYFSLVTASTVGYGDITPTTQEARLFGLSVLILGTASFAIVVGAVLAPAIESRITQALGHMTQSQLEMLEDHIIVLGYGDLTEPIVNELATNNNKFIIVTADQSRAAELSDRDFKVLTADPSDEDTLERVQINAAKAIVVATNNDAEDALAVLTARQMNPDIRIVAAATQRENVRKLKRAGADTVISPATIGGYLLVQSALGQEGIEKIADEVLESQLAFD